VAEQVPGMLVKRRVKKVGSGSQANRPPGDIDVLVFNTLHRTIYVLECKNLAFARTPFELASELRALTESTPHHKSIIEKHQRRVHWVRENLAVILAWARLDGAEPWAVRSAVVVDEPVMSPKLRGLGEPVFGFTDLSDGEPLLDQFAAGASAFALKYAMNFLAEGDRFSNHGSN
jgi:hypothetical protein